MVDFNQDFKIYPLCTKEGFEYILRKIHLSILGMINIFRHNAGKSVFFDTNKFLPVLEEGVFFFIIFPFLVI